MDTYQVKPVYNREKKDIFVSVPGSKSITNRALLLATNNFKGLVVVRQALLCT